MSNDHKDPGFDELPTPVDVRHPHPTRPAFPDDAPEWMLHAHAELGVHEVAGEKFAPRIIEYFGATSISTSPLAGSDETAWCSAFACWCMERSGLKSPHRANARSWMKWGDVLTTPRFGCVVVFWRGTPQSAQGHVAFYVGESGENLQVLGGNQANSVCFSLYPKARVLGYRWPKAGA